MSFHHFRQEHNTVRQGMRWLDQLRSQLRTQRIAPEAKFIPYWDEWRHKSLPQWKQTLQGIAQYIRCVLYPVLLHVWRQAQQSAGDALSVMRPWWNSALQNVNQYADHTFTVTLPQWGHALHNEAQHTAHAARVLIAQSARVVDRHVPFHLHERAGRRGMANAVRAMSRWLAILLIGITATAFAFSMASHASLLTDLRLPQPAPSGPNVTGSVALHQDAAPAATATPPVCQIGMWTSTPNPPASGTIKVYVRITQDMQPKIYTLVTLQAQGGGSVSVPPPWYTDTYGLVVFTVSYSGLSSGSPVLLTASVSIGSQTCSGQTTLIY